MIGYPLDRIYEEVAFIAYYFHWQFEDVISLEHPERRRWCKEISRINKNINQHTEKRI